MFAKLRCFLSVITRIKCFFYSICLLTYKIYNKPNTPQPVSRPSLSSPCQTGPTMSSPAMSILAFSLVHHCPVLQFQSPLYFNWLIPRELHVVMPSSQGRTSGTSWSRVLQARWPHTGNTASKNWRKEITTISVQPPHSDCHSLSLTCN